MPAPPPLSILAIGDLGGTTTDHVGDEAMFAANVELLARELPGVRIVALSRDPEATTRRHGVPALPPIGFPAETEAARRRLAEVLDQAAPDPATARVLEALDAADALLVSGGGNLNSTWPQHLFERLALLSLAQRRGKTTVLLGQTLGPHFEEAERNELAALLRAVTLVGTREATSHDLLALWRVPAERCHDQLDDAAFLAGEVPRELELPAGSFGAVTFSGGLQARDAAARELAAIADGTGLPLVFVPHAAHPDGDRELGQDLEARLGGRLRALPLLEPAATAAVTARAALVVSGRYHPLVFALAAGVPAVGVFFDEYTRVKVRGALGRAGLADWSLPAALAWEGGLAAAALEAWSQREGLQSHLARGRERWRSAAADHARIVAAALRGQPRPPAGPVDLDPGPSPVGSWCRVAGAWTIELERALRERQQLAYFRDVAAAYARALEGELAATRTAGAEHRP